MVPRLAPLLLCAALPACVAFVPDVPVSAELDGRAVRTTVDSGIARYYLESWLRGERTRPEWDAAIAAAERELALGVPSHERLREIAGATSIDVAAVALWRTLSREPANRDADALFREELASVRAVSQVRGAASASSPDPQTAPALPGAAVPRDAPALPGATAPLIVFVPGWFYRSQPQNGGDFAGPRRTLGAAGARTALLEIDENGSVEANARLIARHLEALSSVERDLVVVSASKAGPEVALALSAPGAAKSVRAWVNIGGVLGGSALADIGTEWPGCWLVEGFGLAGGSFDGIASMRTGRSRERAGRVAIPPRIRVLNYVGIPLSGQVSERARLGYALLRTEGPNDGLMLVADGIQPGGATIAELGLDHFFVDPEIDLKAVALARVVARLSGWTDAAATE